MSISNQTLMLDATATTIREQLAAVAKLQGDTLLANRLIGDALIAAKDLLDKTTDEDGKAQKGAFGEWCEAQGFGFSRQWRALLMSLSANWKAIEKAMAKTGPVKSVEKAVALVKPAPIAKAEQPKLLALLAEAESGDEDAQKKLDREAKKHRVTPETFQEKLDKIKERQAAAPKETPEDTIAKLTAQISQLLDLLQAHGIEPGDRFAQPKILTGGEGAPEVAA
jgi:hypothetical protein